MVPPPDETPESLDGQVTRDGEPDRPVEKSLGEGETAGNDPSTDSGGEAFGEDWTPPEMLADRYRLEEKIGQGGMGVVYRAHDTNLNITIAVKLISGGTIERFRTEAQSIAALNHPNIVRVYEFNQQDGLHYIVMEHVEGESLSQRLDREGTIPPEKAIGITVSLCEALSHAHGEGIIHRDIKPSNVLLSDEGVPKLVDFGLARIESDDGQLTRGGLGTPAYVAPEQAKDGTLADARSDLWSLAASLYHMVTGRIPRVIQLRDLADSLQEVLGKALEDAPDSRYQSADDFRDALKVALDSPVAHQPRMVPEGVLAEGECPSCGTANDSSRKFCRERECAAPLRVSCFSCEEQIPVWDEVCGECGGKQAELLEQRRSSMQEQRDEAEFRVCQHEYTRARELAVQVQSKSDPRLQDHQDWATAFLDMLEEQKPQLNATADSIGMKLRLIPAGEFMMGSPATESDREDDETQHRVSITKPFYLGVTEVTQEQYQTVMGTNPSQFKGPQNPVERVNWADAVEFCRKLSAMPAEKTAGYEYRLPTEAEWEYACRSGTTTAYGFGDDASGLGDYGWFRGNSDSSTHPVGEKKPNAWDLYDMHGNVWEWCQDWYGDYPSGSATDPTGATSGSLRVFRGGCWYFNARYCRSAYRTGGTPVYRNFILGFRVLRSSIK